MEREDFEHVGDATEGFSGSDLSVLVREALMEPLRVCQQAKQFMRVNPESMRAALTTGHVRKRSAHG